MMKELRLDYPKCVLGRLLNVSASGYVKGGEIMYHLGGRALRCGV